MAIYKLVFVDIERDGKEGFSVHIEDENNNMIEKLEMNSDEVTPALAEALQQWAEYQFAADQIVDEEDNVIGGIDFENKSSTKH